MVLWCFYEQACHVCLFRRQALILVMMVRLSCHKWIGKTPYWHQVFIYFSSSGLTHLLFLLNTQWSLLKLYLLTHGRFYWSASHLLLFQLNPMAFRPLNQQAQRQRLVRIHDSSSLSGSCLSETFPPPVRYFYLSSCFGLRHRLERYCWCFN